MPPSSAPACADLRATRGVNSISATRSGSKPSIFEEAGSGRTQLMVLNASSFSGMKLADTHFESDSIL